MQHGDNERSGPETGAGTWRESLKQVTDLLATMERDSEAGFLSVGSQLHDIHTRTRQVSARLVELVDQFATEHTTDVLTELQVMTERSTAQLGTFDDFARQAQSHLQSLEAPIRTLPDSLAEFSRLVAHLRVMGITTRIETARIGDNGIGFEHLAEAVTLLGEGISTKAKEVGSYIGSIGGVIRANTGRLLGLCDKHEEIREEVSSNIQSNVDILNEKQELHHKTTAAIALKSENAIRSINSVVESIQFHDITRQQVAHILAALREVIDAPSETDVVPVCEVQAAQLKRAGKEFDDAILTIITALGELSTGVRMMLAESEQMTSFTRETGNTFFDNIEHRLERVGATMMEDWYAIQEVVKSLQDTGETVRKMKSFMDEMAEVGSEIELLALNSRVRAAHVGSRGAALGVIAEAIQNLSTEARVNIDALVQQMSSMVSLSDVMCNNALIDGVTEHAETETREILGRLQTSMRMFHDSNAANAVVFVETERVFTEVAGILETMAADIGRHREFGASLIEAGFSLETMTQRMRETMSPGSLAQIEARLEELRRRYTMHTERTTHDNVVNGEEGTGKDGNPGEALGGNIELF